MRRAGVPAFVPALVLALAALGGCSDRSAERPSGMVGRAESAPPAQALAVAEAPAPARASGAPEDVASGRQGEPGIQSTVQVPAERKVIRNGQASLEVPSVEQAMARLRAMVTASGGYTTDEVRAQDEYGTRNGSITCRVPAGKLDATIENLKGLGKLEQIRLSSADITEQYFNLEIRLRNQRQLESRMLELLKRPSNRLSDLLEVERELARVRGEIDQMEGRQRFWDAQVALSELVVQLHEPRPVVAGDEGGALHALKKSFSEAADNFVLATAGVIGATGPIIPVAIALLIAAWLIRLVWRAWRRRRKA